MTSDTSPPAFYKPRQSACTRPLLLLVAATLLFLLLLHSLPTVLTNANTTTAPRAAIAAAAAAAPSTPNPCPQGATPVHTRSRDPPTCARWSDAVFRQRIYAVNSNGARYLVCVPAKNGSTYHRGLIFRILNIDGYDRKKFVHSAEEHNAKMTLNNFTDAQIASFFADPTMPRYAVVRNPVLRTLSGYLTAIGWKLPDNVDKKKHFQNWVLSEFPTKNMYSANQHFRLQVSYCGFTNAKLRKYFTFMRFEEPEKYVDFLYNIIPDKFLRDGWGKEENASFRDFVLGPRKRTHDTEEKFFDFVGSMRVFDLIANAVKDDTEFLGYKDDVALLRRQLEEKLRNKS